MRKISSHDSGENTKEILQKCKRNMNLIRKNFKENYEKFVECEWIKTSDENLKHNWEKQM